MRELLESFDFFVESREPFFVLEPFEDAHLLVRTIAALDEVGTTVQPCPPSERDRTIFQWPGTQFALAWDRDVLGPAMCTPLASIASSDCDFLARTRICLQVQRLAEIPHDPPG